MVLNGMLFFGACFPESSLRGNLTLKLGREMRITPPTPFRALPLPATPRGVSSCEVPNGQI
uniref:Uncharacterized protein n=1 Tax=Anguilla anguilla TaxID=7936 RepID=A0A0E9U3R2_ANGAN